jgi:hypothetical protein
VDTSTNAVNVELDGTTALTLSNTGTFDLQGATPALGSLTFTGAGNNSAVTLDFVPEPAALSVLGLGALALVGRRRR